MYSNFWQVAVYYTKYVECFVLLPASLVSCKQPRVDTIPYSHILRFITSRNAMHCLQLKPYSNVICKFVGFFTDMLFMRRAWP